MGTVKRQQETWMHHKRFANWMYRGRTGFLISETLKKAQEMRSGSWHPSTTTAGLPFLSFLLLHLIDPRLIHLSLQLSPHTPSVKKNAHTVNPGVSSCFLLLTTWVSGELASAVLAGCGVAFSAAAWASKGQAELPGLSTPLWGA